MSKSRYPGILYLTFNFWSVVIVNSTLFLVCLAFQTHAQLPNSNFTRSDSVAAQYKGASLQNIPVLSYNLTHALSTDVEKFRAIFKWVADNVSNDYELFIRNHKMRAKLKDPVERKVWNTEIQAQVFQRLRDRKSTVCTGYAYLIKELCSFAGIAAEIVDGYGRTFNANVGGDGIVNHSWNAVRLNNKWYFCDPTWASGVIDITEHRFVQRYEDVYFLSARELFVRNHYPLEKKWLLTDSTLSLKTFLNQPIVYAAAYKHGVLPSQPNVFDVAVDDKTLKIRMTANRDLALKSVRLKINGRFSMPSITRSPEGELILVKKFKRSGRFIIHAMIEEDVLFTYRVEVR